MNILNFSFSGQIFFLKNAYDLAGRYLIFVARFEKENHLICFFYYVKLKNSVISFFKIAIEFFTANTKVVGTMQLCL